MKRVAIGLGIAGAVLVLLYALRPELVTIVLSLAFVLQVLETAIPYSLAATCGAITERSGVIDLALEAKLLFGAFAAAAVAHATGSAYAGVAGGMAAGVAVAAVQIGFALWLRADQVIIGVALNLMALGGTRFLLQVLYNEGANSPLVPDLGSVVVNPIAWLAVLAPIAVAYAVVHTRWGLRLRAAGDRPDALVAVGASPVTARFAAGLVGGALAGAGGAQLSLSVNGFVADVSSGRGYMALAMVILAGWRPAIAALACLGVAVTEVLGHQLQGTALPHELVPLLPYIATLVVLAIGGTRPPPRALGRL
jgi:general nucleoside transport system permease protein